MPTELALRFLRGAQRAIRVGGFNAVIERTIAGGTDPDNPLGPDLAPVTTTKTASVFVGAPERTYQNGTLIEVGDGTLLVDLLSIPGNSETEIVFTPGNGDYLVYPNGSRQVLSNTVNHAVNNQTVLTVSAVTG